MIAELGITTIESVASKTRVITEIFTANLAIQTIPAGVARPEHTHPDAGLKPHNFFSDADYSTDNFMPWNKRKFGLVQVTVVNMEIGSTYTTGFDDNENPTPSRLWIRNIF